jgi:Cysteine rich repeat
MLLTITIGRGDIMMKIMGVFAILGILIFSGVAAAAEKGIIETFAEGCKADIEKYCKDVKPGDGRVLACLYANSEKISPRCEYALYDAASQLERALTALTYVANECRDDLKANCSKIEPGEGRLLTCLEKNDAKVSGRCKQALKDVGLKK